MFEPADAPDPDEVYANYLRTCATCGIEPVPRERAGESFASLLSDSERPEK